jgi:hypothetical protein
MWEQIPHQGLDPQCTYSILLSARLSACTDEVDSSHHPEGEPAIPVDYIYKVQKQQINVIVRAVECLEDVADLSPALFESWC